MANKNSIIKAAQKFALSGQIDAAISEWSKLIAVSKDGNVHNTIGDLYLKKGAQNEAVEAFTKAANIFREEGFYPKAIALNKKILNIVPHKLDARITLAELNAERGFNSQAAEDLVKIADKLVADNEGEKALDIYEKALRATPLEIGIKIKIADLSHKLGQKERALKGFNLIASEYLENGDPDKAKEFYDRVIEADPENAAALMGLSTLAEGENNTDQAMAYLSKAALLSPDDRNIMRRYADLAIREDKTEEGRETLLKLIESDPSDTEAKKLLGSLYIKEGEIENAWEELQPYINIAIDRNNWSEALVLLNDFREIQSIPVRQCFIDVYRGKGDNEMLLIELKGLAALYEKQGSLEQALQAYRELAESFPDNEEIRGKIRELENAMGLQSSAPGASHSLENAPPADENFDVLPEPEETGIPVHDENAISAEYLITKKTEADFYALQGMPDEALKIYMDLNASFPGNEEIESALNELKASGASAEETVAAPDGQSPPSSTDMNNAMEEILEDEDTEAIPIELDTPSTDINTAMSEILQDIEGGAEPGEEDYEAHFQSGINYRREGRLDEAVRELKIAARDPDKSVRNARMLALCYMENGSYGDAVKEFTKVIEFMSPDDTGYLDVMYEMAEACVKNNDNNTALKAYTDIHSQDPTFRDVSQKLDELNSCVTAAADTRQPEPAHEPEPEDKTGNNIKPKKSRISYL